MTADKNPLEDAVDQVLDAFVYAPIGFLFDGPARFPKLVRNGKSQVNNARMLGPFAIQQARTQVGKRTADLDNPVVDLLRGLGVVPGAPTVPAATRPAPAKPTPAEEAQDEPAEQPPAKAPAAEKAAAKKAPAKKRPAKKASAKKASAKKASAKKAATRPATKKQTTKTQASASTAAAKKAAPTPPTSERAAAEEAVEARTAAVDAATPSVDVLPIPDYDSLSASQVVSRLDGLGAGQLDAIRAYEAATRGRKTILNRVQQLSKP